MASKKAPVAKVEFPRTVADEQRELQSEINELSKIYRDMQAKAMKALADSFHLAGGCPRCNGRGWVVVWDTMDSLSGCYAEYGTCDHEGCTEESRKRTGMNLGHDSRYDRNRNSNITAQRAASPIWTALVTPYETMLADLNIRQRDLESAAKVVKGSRVVVKRGKTDVGKVGVVAYIKGGEWGDRVLLKDEDKWQDRAADGVWVYAKNVSVLSA